MIKFDHNKPRFDEAFLYLVEADGIWAVETQIFPPDQIESLADMICQFTNNPFASTFTSEDGFNNRFRENLQLIMWEHIQGEKRYRLHKDRTGAKGNRKAVTQAEIDIKSMLDGMTTYAEFLNLNPEKAGHYLESLRKPCQETTLRLLDYVTTGFEVENISFTYSFTYKTWSPTKIAEMESHLRAIQKILLTSKTRGGPSAAVISPIISNLVYVLACLYRQYSGKMPTRSVALDTNAPPRSGRKKDEETYLENSRFKRFCWETYELVNEQLQLDEELRGLKSWNKAEITPNSLDGAIRRAIKQLKELGLTDP